MPQIEFTDKELERVCQLVGDFMPVNESEYRDSEDYNLGVSAYNKLEAAKRTPAQIVVEEMHNLMARIAGPKDIDSVLYKIRVWAEKLEAGDKHATD